jgi:Fe-S cluster assembly protein SufD
MGGRMNQEKLFETYQAQYDEMRAQTEPAWLQSKRATAYDAFLTQGIPTTRMETWKYTPLRTWEKNTFHPQALRHNNVDTHEVKLFSMLDENSYDVVFIDGQYHAKLSGIKDAPARIIIIPLAQAIKQYPTEINEHFGQALQLEKQPFASLCASLAQQGMVIIVPDDTHIENPIHLLFATSSKSEMCETQIHNLFIIGKNSKVEIIEHYADLNDVVYFNNVLTEVILGRGAQLSHYKIDQEGNRSFHIGALHVKQYEGSELISNAVTLSGNLSRHDIITKMIEPGALCTLNGLYFPHNKQHVDYHTTITHEAENCSSQSLYKGVLAGQSSSVFNGSVIVKPYAQHTQSNQANHNLLLSPGCEANSKPELEIYADDVRCTHGATTGQLNEDALFFLQSRGIAPDKARRMLIRAFANEVFNLMPSESVRNYCQRYLEMAAYE